MPKLTCIIDSILFPKPGQPRPENGYAIVRATDVLNGKPFGMKGSMPGVHPGAEVTVEGEWKSDRYGLTLVVNSYEERMPQSLDGIRNFLASGLIKGLGDTFASLIVDKFGEDTMRVLDEEPERISEIKGIGKKKAQTIIGSWKEQKGVRDVMVFLKTYDVGNAVAAKIYAKYKENSIGIVRSNPYVLADEVDGVGFLTADRIALSMGVERAGTPRIRSALLYGLEEASEKGGDVYSNRGEIVPAVLELLNDGAPEDGCVTEGEVLRELSEMRSRREVFCEGEDDERVYLPMFYHSERNTAVRLAALCRKEDKEVKDIDFDGLERRCGVEFDSVQKDAISLAARSRVCVITGGPGTGKTTTMKGVIAEAQGRKLKVLLAAPTGRASKRLSETTGLPAGTIHRLLEFRPGEGFTRDDGRPLEGDLLVVDESSMIDVMLMNGLLKAVPPSMRVVFVGDVDQLPSVGAGNVLRDMIGSGCIPTVRLTRIFRQAQGSLIVSNAHAINHGLVPKLPCDLTPQGEDFCFIGRDETEKIQKDILELVPKYIPENFGLKPSDIQVLSPMRRGPLGTEEFNRLIQREVNPNGVSLKRGAVEFRKGDRVMQMKNNYEWDVFNGDLGLITAVDTEKRTLTVNFDGKVVEAKGVGLEQLDLAYACTIHKSQGSEYPVVIVPATMSHYVMLTRNLLYTAVTRAKSRCVIVGDKRAVMAMIANNSVKKRNSALSEKIGENFGKKVSSVKGKEEAKGEVGGLCETLFEATPEERAELERQKARQNSLVEKKHAEEQGRSKMREKASQSAGSPAGEMRDGWMRVVRGDGKVNFANADGVFLAKNWLEWAEDFDGGVARIRKGNTGAEIDVRGKVIKAWRIAPEESHGGGMKK